MTGRATGHEALLASFRDPALTLPQNFLARTAALGHLDFFIASNDGVAEALTLRDALEAVDAALFASLRKRIGPETGAGLRGADLLAELNALVPPAARLPLDAPGYDALDLLVDGVLFPETAPEPVVSLTPDMVGLQQAPARVILELAALSVERASSDDAARGGPRSRFCDIGSGLGRVPLLLHLLTGRAAHGLDLEPAYVDAARACAADLRLENVTFTTGDARTADLGCKARTPEVARPGADTFFLYTPFRGALLAEVLDRLVTQAPAARVFTYGPCSVEVSAHPGFRRVLSGDISPDRLEEFEGTAGTKSET